MLDVDGRGVTRTEWAKDAVDAVRMACMNHAAAEHGAKNVRLVHVGPPQAEVLAAQQELMAGISAAAKLAMDSQG